MKPLMLLVLCLCSQTALAAPLTSDLLVRCVGGAQSPTVVLEWKKHSGSTTNSVQKGDSYPNDPDKFWEHVGNDVSSFFYEDRNVKAGATYTYRVKYTPDQQSNSVQITVDEATCGTGVLKPGEITARCYGSVKAPQVVVEWTKGNGKLNALQRGKPTDEGGTYWAFMPNNTGIYSYLDLDLIPNYTYSYRVKYAPAVTSNTFKIPIDRVECGPYERPYYYVTGYCEGGPKPRVVLEWGTADGTITQPLNALQKGDIDPNDPNSFWGFMNNDASQYIYEDRDVKFGQTYSYRVKYTPALVSNEFKIDVTGANCGCKPGQCP